MVARQRTLASERNSFDICLYMIVQAMGVTCAPQQLGQYISKVKDVRVRACPELAVYTPPVLLDASWWTETMFNAFRHMRPVRAASDGVPMCCYGQEGFQQQRCMGN